MATARMGMNAMEMDTAIRHKIPLLIVISLNGGWTGDPKREKPGRDLGYMRYDKMCEALGGYGEYVTKPEDITPALERAQKKVDEGDGGAGQRAHRLSRALWRRAVLRLLDLTLGIFLPVSGGGSSTGPLLPRIRHPPVARRQWD